MLYLQIINTLALLIIILFVWANWKTEKQIRKHVQEGEQKYKDQIKFRDEMLANQRKILDYIDEK